LLQANLEIKISKSLETAKVRIICLGGRSHLRIKCAVIRQLDHRQLDHRQVDQNQLDQTTTRPNDNSTKRQLNQTQLDLSQPTGPKYQIFQKVFLEQHFTL
jgi:hypothetical protein